MSIKLPIATGYVVLPDDPADSAQRATALLAAWQASMLEGESCRKQLSQLAAQYPTSLYVWASLGELSLPHDVIAAYAFFRTGYHRGLDRARAAGWNGQQQLRWEHESNRGFLRCLYGLMRAATDIGEQEEAMRTCNFLLDLDPANPFGLERA